MSVCPGAPQLEFLLGRKDGTRAAPDGLVPEPFGEYLNSILHGIIMSLTS